MVKIHLSVNLSKARDNSTWAVSWLAELTVTPPLISLPLSPISVCPSKKPPCVDSKRPCVYRHHARMFRHMCAWCRCIRGRFESTHGGFFLRATPDTEDKTKEKTREDQERYDVLCVWLCVFLKITRPSNDFEFSKLPLSTLKELKFPGNFLFVRLQNKIVSRIILVIIFPPW